MQSNPNPSGACLCGCGEKTPIARYNRPGRGWVKGEPVRYLVGHAARKPGPTYRIDASTGCWEWLRYRSADGYGHVRRGGKVVSAHRAMWEQTYGPLAPDVDVHHTCENRGCVNPAHLATVHETHHPMLHSVLSPDDVRAIRSVPFRYGSGRALAVRYGVAEGVISSIRHGRSWKHVA